MSNVEPTDWEHSVVHRRVDRLTGNIQSFTDVSTVEKWVAASRGHPELALQEGIGKTCASTARPVTRSASPSRVPKGMAARGRVALAHQLRHQSLQRLRLQQQAAQMTTLRRSLPSVCDGRAAARATPRRRAVRASAALSTAARRVAAPPHPALPAARDERATPFGAGCCCSRPVASIYS